MIASVKNYKDETAPAERKSVLRNLLTSQSWLQLANKDPLMNTIRVFSKHTHLSILCKSTQLWYKNTPCTIWAAYILIKQWPQLLSIDELVLNGRADTVRQFQPKKNMTEKFSLQRKPRIITLAPFRSINHRLYFVGVTLKTKKIIACMHRKQLHRKTTHSVVITIRIKLWESTLVNCFMHAIDRALVGLPLNKVLFNFRVRNEHSANVGVHGSVKL